MSNVGHKYWQTLHKSPLRLGSLTQLFYNDRQLFHASKLHSKESGPSRENSNAHAYEQRSSSSSSSASSSSSSSSAHQQFHRYSYERKRANYQNERTKHSNQNRAEPLFSNSSMNHYQRLNIDPTSDISNIKSAYYSLSKQYHPDLVGSEDSEAAENFRLITESYDILSDPKSRSDYDKTLQQTTQSAPEFTSWQPGGSRTSEQDHMNRMREAGRIIKSRKDELFEREKMQNPQKYRAGTFRVTSAVNPVEELERLNRRLELLSRTPTLNFDSGEEENKRFYRAHLADTIRRRHEDMKLYQDLNSRSTSMDDTLLIMSLLTVLGGFTIAFLIVGSNFLGLDLAAYLDDKLSQSVRKMEANKTESRRE